MATTNRRKAAKAAIRRADRRDAINPHRTALSAEAVAERHAHARSGAAGVHGSRSDRRARTRSTSRDRAIRSYME